MTTRVLAFLSTVLAVLVFTLPARAEESRWALLVGIDDYVDPAISDLTGSVNDVIAIREALVTAAHFPSSQVFLLTSDDPAAAPTKGNIRARLRYIAERADSDDLVYLHFSLHAVVDGTTGDGYLLTHRTDPREYRSDAFPVSEIKAWIEDLAAPKRMLVIDGCRNDPERGRGDAPNSLDARFSRGLTIVPRQAPSATAFTQVLFACGVGQRAYEWPGKDRGLFSIALEEALLGEADEAGGDRNGRVELLELTAYVRSRVPDLVQLNLPDVRQVPDVADPPKAAGGYVLADAQPNARKVVLADLPAMKARPAEIEDLEAVVTRKADKAPTLRITSVPSEPLRRVDAQRVTIRYEADVDRGVKGYRYRLDDGAIVETPRAFADVSAPEPGTHTVQVQVQDWWGNWSAPAKCEFTVLANQRPSVSFEAPPGESRVNGLRLDVRLVGRDEGSVVRYRLALDDPDRFVEKSDRTFSFENVVDGPHTLYAQAIDDEGAASLWESLDVTFMYVDPSRQVDHARKSIPVDDGDPALPRVKIETSLGSMTLVLYADKAPMTVEHFLQYVDDGHYDGTIFHRVIDDFMVQGGGYDTSLRLKETRGAITNEARNGLKNDYGTLAMARAADPDSADAQFFINVQDNEALNYKGTSSFQAGYCVFGRVVDGLEVLEALRRVPVVKNAKVGPETAYPRDQVVITKVERSR